MLSVLLIGFIVAVCFSTNQENLYMIHLVRNLIYDNDDTITEKSQR